MDAEIRQPIPAIHEMVQAKAVLLRVHKEGSIS